MKKIIILLIVLLFCVSCATLPAVREETLPGAFEDAKQWAESFGEVFEGPQDGIEGTLYIWQNIEQKLLVSYGTDLGTDHCKIITLRYDGVAVFYCATHKSYQLAAGNLTVLAITPEEQQKILIIAKEIMGRVKGCGGTEM